MEQSQGYSFLSQPYRPLPSTPSSTASSTSSSPNSNQEELPTYSTSSSNSSFGRVTEGTARTYAGVLLEAQQASKERRDKAERIEIAASLGIGIKEEEVEEEEVEDDDEREVEDDDERVESKNQQCWICLGEESDGPGEKFIHACKCTLIAHESCLLEWVTQQSIPHCPACNSVYVIHQKNPLILGVYKKFMKFVDTASLVVSALGIGTGIWLSATSYSILVSRFWIGKGTTQQLFFNQRWPVAYYFKLPSIPFLLILSRTNLVDSLFPFISLLLATTSTSTTLGRGSGFPLNIEFNYPPSANLTFIILPWIRLSYLFARKRVYKFFGRKISSGLIGILTSLDTEVGLDLDDDDVIGGGGGNRAGDNIVLVAEVEQVFNGPPQEANGNGNAAVVEGNNILRQRISLGRFNTLLISTLISPFLAAVGGAGLYYLASKETKFSLILRKVLGVSSLFVSTASGLNSLNKSSTSNLSGIGGLLNQVGLSNSLNWFKSITLPRSTSSSINSTIVDPIWIRNSIGLGLIIFFRDLIELIIFELEDKRKKSRKVVAKEFENRSGGVQI